MIFQFSTLKNRHRSRARVDIIDDYPGLDQFADLALWKTCPVADPATVESVLMTRLCSVPDRRFQRSFGTRCR